MLQRLWRRAVKFFSIPSKKRHRWKGLWSGPPRAACDQLFGRVGPEHCKLQCRTGQHRGALVCAGTMQCRSAAFLCTFPRRYSPAGGRRLTNSAAADSSASFPHQRRRQEDHSPYLAVTPSSVQIFQVRKKL